MGKRVGPNQVLDFRIAARLIHKVTAQDETQPISINRIIDRSRNSRRVLWTARQFSTCDRTIATKDSAIGDFGPFYGFGIGIGIVCRKRQPVDGLSLKFNFEATRSGSTNIVYNGRCRN
jgi:hypothetical protein